jgi:hypothetical protein
VVRRAHAQEQLLLLHRPVGLAGHQQQRRASEMNERIRELAEQAQDWADAQAPLASEEHEYFYEKFAELLLHECSRIADDWVNNEDNGKNYPSDKIKQHFGGLVR